LTLNLKKHLKILPTTDCLQNLTQKSKIKHSANQK